MPLNRHRKAGPGRTPASIIKPRPKRERLEVFRILAGDKIEPGPDGWFMMPWRQGSRWVVGMIMQLWSVPRLDVISETPDERAARQIIVSDFPDPSMAYSACDEARAALLTAEAPQARIELLLAALRARQLDIARSDAGGHAYNALLLSRWRLFDIGDDTAAAIVRDARCRDVIGKNAMYRRAFLEAWDAGLYRAACSLQ